VDELPRWLTMSYNSMKSRWGTRPLGLYIKSNPPERNQPQIILLQHASEMNKKTATGWLLDDNLYFKWNGGNFGSPQLNLKVKLWVWAGRDDASKIEKRLLEVSKKSKVYLLWTDPGGEVPNIHNSTHCQTDETYIILDGTWQEAKSMFRKTPALWKLPRLSLDSNDVPPSEYVLRGDYGWKERFGNDVDSKSLLCTAEIASAVVDRLGDTSTANEIRERLRKFQDSYTNRKLS